VVHFLAGGGSMSPVRAARVRSTIRRHERSALEALASSALACRDRHQVLTLVQDALRLDPL
jgi:phosphoenolpyruvate-protein kinase (PTS system EI component)